MAAPPDPHPIVVVGFDGSPASHLALSRAIERVGPYGKLYLVHAWEVPEAWRGRGIAVRSLELVAAVAAGAADAAADRWGDAAATWAGRRVARGRVDDSSSGRRSGGRRATRRGTTDDGRCPP